MFRENAAPAVHWIDHHRRPLWVAAGIILVLGAAAAIGGHQAGPLLRTRMQRSLSARFGSEVQLKTLDVSFFPLVSIVGRGLVIPNPDNLQGAALISIQKFELRTHLWRILTSPLHFSGAHVQGLAINVPSREERGKHRPKAGSVSGLLFDRVICENTALTISTNKPGKLPLVFDIRDLQLDSAGTERPMSYTARLVNPKPRGDIEARGDLGPWNLEDPRSTPLSGTYTFSRADLATIPGISGILSSKGAFSGILERIEAHGETRTPDFAVNVGGHPVNLETTFTATIDGSEGDTYLHPVQARFLGTALIAEGSVVRRKNPDGLLITLHVSGDQARVEDLLLIAVNRKPVLQGPINLRFEFVLPPGNEVVTDRLNLNGTFQLKRMHFTADRVQEKVDRLSVRAQGHPEEAKADVPDVLSTLRGSFALHQGLVTFSKLAFTVPGATIDLKGTFGLRSQDMDFHGTARFDAKLSQMTTGFKSLLLKAADPFFKQKGSSSGAELPIRITGSKANPSFQVDMGKKATQR